MESLVHVEIKDVSNNMPLKGSSQKLSTMKNKRFTFNEFMTLYEKINISIIMDDFIKFFHCFKYILTAFNLKSS